MHFIFVHLCSAPDSVKKIFSVAHLGKKEYNALVIKELCDRVRRHEYDQRTAETRSKFLGCCLMKTKIIFQPLSVPNSYLSETVE